MSVHPSQQPSLYAPTIYSFIPPHIEQKIQHHYSQGSTLESNQKLVLQQSSISTLGHLRALRSMVSPATSLVSFYLKQSPIEVWDANTGPEKLVLSRTKSLNPDTAAQNCFSNMAKTDDFCRKVFEINPVNNFTKLMKAHIHCESYRGASTQNNAFWSAETEEIYFGEVDPEIFHPLVNNFDVTAHEFGHALTDFSSHLTYTDQSGALNESFSDVVAITAKHFFSKTNADNPDANWLIGDGLIVNNETDGTAIRSLKQPGTAYRNHPILGEDPQPAHMQDYAYITKDFGGVHTNSGIPNHAYYLAATQIGGPTWEKPVKIWYEALTSARRDDNFSQFALHTLHAAKKLRYSESIQNLVGKAWHSVGVELQMVPSSK